MDTLPRATQLLLPFMEEARRQTWLTLAFHGEHQAVYDAIPVAGATKDFTVRCVRLLLDRGCLGPRHALSLLLEVVRSEVGEEKQAAFQTLISELDHPCIANRPTPGSPPARPASPERDLVYISYRHQDRVWQRRLRRVLDADPRLRGRIWDDTEIPGGADWQREIAEHVPRARAMIMLANDEYFDPGVSGAYELEIVPALAAHAQGVMGILWVPVRPLSIAASPVRHITAATGAGSVPLERLSTQEQAAALIKVYSEVLRQLGMPAEIPDGVAKAAAQPGGSTPLGGVRLATDLKKEQPMRLEQIPDTRRDLQKIAGCENPDRAIDIVFIHGLGGDSWTTWMTDKDDITTFWPYWLAEDLREAGLWTLGYAASGSKWKEESMPLADRGNQVLDLLSNEGLGERPLAFITHSMGGIVAKQILRNAESFGVKRFEAISATTRGIAFIATPHSGAKIANFAELAAAIYRTNEHVEELAAHDPRLRELHGWFLNKYLDDHDVICRTYCEKRELRPEIPLLGIRLPKGILVVDETSAEPNIKGERAIPLDEDHVSICKPASRDAQLYKGILRFLRECLAATARP